MTDFSEETMDEYFELSKRTDLTEEEEKRKEEILLTGMLVRALGGKFETEEENYKLRKMIFINPDDKEL